MADSSIRTWALKGAEQRLLEISEEAAAIYSAFPELRGRGQAGAQRRRGPGRPRSAQAETDAGAAPARRRRRGGISAEGRRRISEAQKARWAKQRADRAGATGAEGASEQRPARRSSSRKKK